MLDHAQGGGGFSRGGAGSLGGGREAAVIEGARAWGGGRGGGQGGRGRTGRPSS